MSLINVNQVKRLLPIHFMVNAVQKQVAFYDKDIAASTTAVGRKRCFYMVKEL